MRKTGYFHFAPNFFPGQPKRKKSVLSPISAFRPLCAFWKARRTAAARGSEVQDVKSGEVQSAAESLVELSQEFSAPTYAQERSYAAIIGGTLMALDRVSAGNHPSESLIEKAVQQTREGNMPLLEAAVSGKGTIAHSKG